MHFSEIYDYVSSLKPSLKLNVETSKNHSTKPYYLRDLVKLRATILKLGSVPGLASLVDELKETAIFKSDVDETSFAENEYKPMKVRFDNLVVGVNSILELQNGLNKDLLNLKQDVIKVKLPNFENFDELQKLTGDLKRSIDIPINNSSTNGKVDVISAEQGSIWFVVALFTPAAVELIGQLCYLAIDIKQKRIENKKHEEYLRGIKATSDMLEKIRDLQSAEIDAYITERAQQISDGYFDAKKNTDSIKIIKLATETFGDLYEKGLLVMAASETPKTIKRFPNLERVKQLKEAVKQITKGE